ARAGAPLGARAPAEGRKCGQLFSVEREGGWHVTPVAVWSARDLSPAVMLPLAACMPRARCRARATGRGKARTQFAGASQAWLALLMERRTRLHEYSGARSWA